MSMLRKTMVVLFAVASIGAFVPDSASARGGHGGGGHGGHGGFGGFHGGGFRRGFGWGMGPDAFFAPDYYFGYPDYADGGCYLVRQRVHTRRGWRYRTVEVCE